jgi:hypothetical protein
MTPSADAEFRKLSAAMVANRMLTLGNIALLEAFCATRADCIALWSQGTMPKAATLQGLRALAVALGLTHLPVTEAPAAPAHNRFSVHINKAKA